MGKKANKPRKRHGGIVRQKSSCALRIDPSGSLASGSQKGEKMNSIRKLLRIVSLAGAAVQIALAQPVIFTALNTASSSAVLSPGSWVSIYGLNFAAAPQTAQSVPLPPTLGGVSVTVAGLAATLRYVSPTQVNALIPFEVAIPTNTVAPLVVTSAAGSGSYNIRLTRDAPAVFSQDGSGFGLALVFDAKFNPVATVHPNDVLILYAAGLGPVDSSGRVVDPVEVYLGERKAQVLFAGLVPGFPGVYQLNVIAPSLATDRLYLRSGGWQSNIVYVGIQAGANTMNAAGSIDGLNPSSDPNYLQLPCFNLDNSFAQCESESLSIMLHAGAFSTSFDIAPSASRFDVAAVGEAGGVIISIDPVAGTYTASVTTVTMAARQGDFHDSVVPLWDYTSCNVTTAVCFPFPGPSILPPSRINPFWARAMQALPTPNTAGTAPNAFTQTSGTLNGSHFAIDAQNNSALSKFGGFVQLPYSPFDLLGSTFTLYVDGTAVAAKSLPYVPAHRCVPTGPLCWTSPGPVVYPPQLLVFF
jgi:uncharacterized protein (TIGR03437 family)